MSNTKLSMKDRAFLIMHLHAIKYHNFDCLGVLIGSKEGETVTVTDAIPLFHQRVQSSMLEIAFDMIESVYLGNSKNQGKKIIGVYEAALPGSLVGGREQTTLAQYICEQIFAQQGTSLFIQVKADFNAQDEDLEVEEQLKESKGLIFKKFLANQNGSIQLLDQSKVQDADCASQKTEYVLNKYVNASPVYLCLADFDDHFADTANCDWRNTDIY